MINQSLFRHLLIFLASASGAMGAEYCGAFKFCDDDYYCCENNTQCCSVTAAVVILLAFVIGGILFVSCVVAVCCCACKNNHRPGQIVQPAQQMGGVALVTTGQQPMYIQQPGPSMYGQPSYGQQPQSGAQFVTQQPYDGNKAGAIKPEMPVQPPTYA